MGSWIGAFGTFIDIMNNNQERNDEGYFPDSIRAAFDDPSPWSKTALQNTRNRSRRKNNKPSQKPEEDKVTDNGGLRSVVVVSQQSVFLWTSVCCSWSCYKSKLPFHCNAKAARADKQNLLLASHRTTPSLKGHFLDVQANPRMTNADVVRRWWPTRANLVLRVSIIFLVGEDMTTTTETRLSKVEVEYYHSLTKKKTTHTIYPVSLFCQHLKKNCLTPLTDQQPWQENHNGRPGLYKQQLLIDWTHVRDAADVPVDVFASLLQLSRGNGAYCTLLRFHPRGTFPSATTTTSFREKRSVTADGEQLIKSTVRFFFPPFALMRRLVSSFLNVDEFSLLPWLLLPPPRLSFLHLSPSPPPLSFSFSPFYRAQLHRIHLFFFSFFSPPAVHLTFTLLGILQFRWRFYQFNI